MAKSKTSTRDLRKIEQLEKQAAEKDAAGKMALQAETNRADRNAKYSEHNAGVAKGLRESLDIERIGRRSLLESFRAERLTIVRDLFRVDQRIRVLLETERGDHNALLAANGQVEDEDGSPLVGPRS